MKKSVRVCDLDERDQRIAVETLSITIDGKQHGLDLCPEHLSWARSLPALRKASADSPTTDSSARRQGSAPAAARDQDTVGGRKLGSRRALQQERTAVREWARSQGREVANRGRLPDGLVNEYRSGTSA